MSKRLPLLLLVMGVLAALMLLDRFVLNPPDNSSLAEPVSRAQNRAPGVRNTVQAPAQDFLPKLAQFNDVWGRPLFTPTREPAAIIATPRTQSRATSASDQPPDITIVGVALGPTNSAVLVREDRNTIKRYYTGESIQGWTIDKITAQNVTVSQDAERWQLPVGAQE